MTALTDPPATGHGSRGIFASGEEQFAAGRLGMILFLGALGMLFGATILGLIAIRLDGSMWPEYLPPMPDSLWVSTLLLLFSSITMQWAVLASRRAALTATRIALGLTLALGLAFMAVQAVAWFAWRDSVSPLVEQGHAMGLAVSGFYVLTGIHAAHVLGGLIPLAILALAVAVGGWTVARDRSVHYTAMYWHFLDLVWVGLVVTLVLVL